jgi:hypothetical protein
MSRIRLILLGMLTVLAVSAVASASASAACSKETGDYGICAENTKTKLVEEYEGLLENENHKVTTVFESAAGGLPVKLEGLEAVAKLTAEDSGKSKGEITFTKVSVIEPANCEVQDSTKKVAKEIMAEFKDQLSTPPVAINDTFTGVGAKKTFTTVEFIGAKCGIKGIVAEITGSQETTFDANIEKMEEHHELFASEAGSKLFLGANAATFETGDTPATDSFKELEPTSNTNFENWAILES